MPRRAMGQKGGAVDGGSASALSSNWTEHDSTEDEDVSSSLTGRDRIIRPATAVCQDAVSQNPCQA